MRPESRLSAGIVEEALGRIFDPAVVGGLREDSQLAVLGMVPADAICIADAIAAVASERGLDCDLGDADLVGAVTVAELIQVVADHATPAGNP
jgi:hypothetical protein